jgi:hypothetical protein
MGFGTAFFASVQFSTSNRRIRFKEEIKEKDSLFCFLKFRDESCWLCILLALHLAGSDFSLLEVHAIEYTIPGAYQLTTTDLKHVHLNHKLPNVSFFFFESPPRLVLSAFV